MIGLLSCFLSASIPSFSTKYLIKTWSQTPSITVASITAFWEMWLIGAERNLSITLQIKVCLSLGASSSKRHSLRNLIESIWTRPYSLTINLVKYSRQKSGMLEHYFSKFALMSTFCVLIWLINLHISLATVIRNCIHWSGLASLVGWAYALFILAAKSTKSDLGREEPLVASDKNFYNF